MNNPYQQLNLRENRKINKRRKTDIHVFKEVVLFVSIHLQEEYKQVEILKQLPIKIHVSWSSSLSLDLNWEMGIYNAHIAFYINQAIGKKRTLNDILGFQLDFEFPKLIMELDKDKLSLFIQSIQG